MQAQGRDKDDTATALHKEKLSSLPSIPLLLIGTSMMERFGWQEHAQAAFLAAGLPGTAFNAGVGGDRVAHILYRLQDLKLLDSYLGKPPELVVLEGGANDLDGKKVDLDLLARGMAQCMDIIRARFPDTHISVVGAFPRACKVVREGKQPSVSEAEVLERVAGFNQQLEQQVALRQAAGGCSFDGRAEDYLQGGRLDPRLFEDEVHLSAEGYHMFAAQLAHIMQQYAPQAQ